MTTSTRVRVLLALLVVVGSCGGVAVGLADATAETDEGGPQPTDNYSLGELRDLGTQPAGAPESVRPYGAAGSFWLRHVPVGVARSDTPDQRQYVSAGDTVQNDYVYIGSFLGWQADELNAQLHVVQWEYHEEQYTTEEGEVRTTREAVNATHQTVDLSMAGGDYDEQRVELVPRHSDRPQYVTMWVDGRQGDTQWVFRYDPSAATADVPISTVGDAVLWGFVWIFLPLLTTGIGVIIVDRKVLEKAGAGPQMSLLEYGFLASGVLFVGAFVAYRGVIDTLATRPWLLGVAGGLFLGLLGISVFGQDPERALFVHLTTEAEADDTGAGTWRVGTEVLQLVDLEDGRGVIRRGWLAFLARAWPFADATPRLEFDGAPTSSSELVTSFEGGTEDAFDEVFFVDPASEDVIDYESEGWSLATPDLLSWPSDARLPSVNFGPLVLFALLANLGYVAGFHLSGGSLAVGALGALFGVFLTALRPNGGYAKALLAPAQYDSVLENMLTHLEGHRESADRSWYQRKFYESKASNRSAAQREREDREQTLFEGVSEELAPDDDLEADQQLREVTDD